MSDRLIMSEKNNFYKWLAWTHDIYGLKKNTTDVITRIMNVNIENSVYWKQMSTFDSMLNYMSGLLHKRQL